MPWGPSRPEGGHPGVAAAELAGQRVDLAQRDVHAAELRGQRVGGVVAGVHQQAVQQLVDGVVATHVDADPGALGVGVVLGAGHHLVQVEFVDRLHGDEHLDDAGGPVPRMRVLGGDHPRRCPGSATTQDSAETSPGTGGVFVPR